MSDNVGTCPCCQRITRLTFHHLIPRKMHRRPRFKKTFTRQMLSEGVNVCRQCHNGIHSFYDEMQLARDLNTLAALLADPKLQRYFAWVGRQRIEVV